MSPPLLYRVLAVAFGLVAACAGTDRRAYEPTTTTSAFIAGRPTAVVALPSGAPTGEMQVTSIGIGRVVPPNDLGLLDFRALFLRMTIHNRGKEAWTVDQGAQAIALVEAGTPVHTRATTPTGSRPHVVSVAPGESVTIDLAFPLAGQPSDDPEKVDLEWTVRIGTETVRGTLAFARRVETKLRRGTPLPTSTTPPPYDIPGRYPTIPTE